MASQRNQFTASIFSKIADAYVAKIYLQPLQTPSTWTSTITKTSATKFSVGNTILGFALPVDVTLSK